MRLRTAPGAPPTGSTLLARAALALYPPAWRARYSDEVRVLLDDSGGGLAAVSSVALIVTIKLLGRPNGIGAWWFLVVTLAGFAAASTAAAGPGLALRRLQPRGPAPRPAAAW
jgi:hypothetical protein